MYARYINNTTYVTYNISNVTHDRINLLSFFKQIHYAHAYRRKWDMVITRCPTPQIH